MIGAFTTAHARLTLYSPLERLQTRIFYFDTDSVIFSSQPNEWMPPLGDYLGELTSELDDDDYISSFVSGRPKNYAYETKNGKTVCKVQSLTLNHRRSKKINFDAMYEQVCRPNGESICLEIPNFIKREPRTKTPHSVQLKRKYNLVYDKRVICRYRTFPYRFP